MVRDWLARGVDGFRLDVFNAFLKDPDLRDNPVIEGRSPWSRLEHRYDLDQPDFVGLIGRFRAILDEARAGCRSASCSRPGAIAAARNPRDATSSSTGR